MTGAEDVDASLQDFSYSFTCGSRLERLSFRTFKERATPGEEEEILSIYTNCNIALQCSGHEVVVQDEAELENVRAYFAARNRLNGEHKSVRWKLYLSRDVYTHPYEEDFAGLCGLSLTESRHLEPHIRLKPEYQNRGIGTKVMFCLLEKVLQHKDWLLENVNGMTLNIHPMNKASLLLKDKLLSHNAVEAKNPDDAIGVWHKIYLFSNDRKKRDVDIRQFFCHGLKSLECLWESKMKQQVNRADFLLGNNFDRSTEPDQLFLGNRPLTIEVSNSQEGTLLETLGELNEELPHGIVDNLSYQRQRSVSPMNKKVAAGKSYQEEVKDIDASLQEFSFTFDCVSRCEKLSFRTMSGRMSGEDRSEVLSVYGNLQVALQTNGIRVIIETEEQCENVWRSLSSRRSLLGKSKSIRWKVYYSRDTNTVKEEFAGFAGLSLTNSGHLEPHVRLRPKYHNRGLGTKLAFCVLEKLLEHRDWLVSNVVGLNMYIHPDNKASLALLQKLLSDRAVENRNAENENGVWSKTYLWFTDNSFRTLQMREFVCPNIRSLELLWESKMNVNVNKADLLWFGSLQPGSDYPTLLSNDTLNKGWELKIDNVDALEDYCVCNLQLEHHHDQKAATDDAEETVSQEFA